MRIGIDAWVSNIIGQIPKTNHPFDLMASKKVSTLVTSNSSWYADLIRDIFVPEDADKILNLIPPSPSRQDKLIWCPAKYGKLSMKSCYKHQFSNNDIGHTTMLN